MPKSNNDAEEQSVKVCTICGREIASGEYCKYHEEAYQTLQEKYTEWLEAYGELSFSDYLQKVIQLSETGIWAKEVAEDIAKKENEK